MGTDNSFGYTSKKEQMDVDYTVRALRKGSEEQLQGSEAASQAKSDREGQEGFAQAEQPTEVFQARSQSDQRWRQD